MRGRQVEPVQNGYEGAGVVTFGNSYPFSRRRKETRRGAIGYVDGRRRYELMRNTNGKWGYARTLGGMRSGVFRFVGSLQDCKNAITFEVTRRQARKQDNG